MKHVKMHVITLSTFLKVQFKDPSFRLVPGMLTLLMFLGNSKITYSILPGLGQKKKASC